MFAYPLTTDIPDRYHRLISNTNISKENINKTRHALINTETTEKKLEIGLEDIKTDSILHRSLQKLAFIELAPSQRKREERNTKISRNKLKRT